MDALAALKTNRAPDAQRAINDAFYRSPLAAKRHPRDGLDAQETVTLLRYQSYVVGRDVLDLGVGAGRTSRVLAGLARAYHAVDYSPLAVARLRKSMPKVRVHLEDMRDLARFDDDAFDFILGAGHVLDVVSHDDRERTLAGARRVLRPGGLIAFSSHNRCYVRAKAGPELHRSRNPLRFALHLARYVASMRVHLRMKALRHFEDDYALIDESGPDHALLHYHVDRNAQERQLRRLGYDIVDVLDRSGQSVAKGEMAPKSRSLMYVARKAT
jgi:SAM-dependent methyltransferase